MIVDVPKMLARLGIDLGRTRERRGEVWAPCPLHEDTDASWSIRNDASGDKHGHWYCFGCRRSGGPIALVSGVIGITEGSAHRWLVENGLVVGEATVESVPTRVRCRIVEAASPELELPTGVHVKAFREWPALARRYLASRGVTAWQQQAHGIGYAIAGKMRGRIVFPSRTEAGRLLYYTGRTFVGDDVRYLSADDQPGARPTASLFGESLWCRRHPDEVYLAEGALKVLAIERATCPIGTGEGGAAVGAFSGSEFHPEQVAKLRRFSFVTYFADNNPTGLRFAERVEGMLSDKAVRVVVPPEGEEADSLTRRELRALLGIDG